jgi:hypothetical protein
MRKLLLLTVVGCLAGAVQHLAAEDYWEQVHTDGQVNGRFWNGATMEGKMSFLMGFTGGLVHAKLIHEAVTVENSYPFSMTNGEVGKALDRFYDTPENMKIPIGFALVICRQRLEGAPEAEIQEHILVFRRYSTTPVIAPVAPTTAKQ